MDIQILKQKIEDATKKAFIEIHNKSSEEIYAFALYSDEGAMTVCPSTNTIEHLENQDKDDFLYYKFEPAEWKYEMKGADEEFDNISEELYKELETDKYEIDSEFEKFQNKLYEICIEVLEKLKNENFFKNIVGKDIFLFFSVSDYEFDEEKLKDIIERLNDNPYKEQYLEWMESWQS